MAVSVIADLTRQHAVDDQYGGATISRTFLVKGLEASQPYQMLIDALNTAGVPQLGDSHPSLSHLVVNSRSADPKDGCSDVWVFIHYGPVLRRDVFAQPLPPVGDNETASREVSVVPDVTVENEDPWHGQDWSLSPPLALDADTRAGLADQTPDVEIERNLLVFRFSRREQNVPTDRGISIVGYVNDTTIDGRAPRTLKCLRCTSRDESGGSWSNVTYEFAYRPDGWEQTIYWRFPSGIPAVTQDASSKKNIRVHQETNFAFLGLDFS